MIQNVDMFTLLETLATLGKAKLTHEPIIQSRGIKARVEKTSLR